MKTKQTPFYRDLSAGPDAFAFSVNAGYPSGHALELADTIMGAALQSLVDAAGNLPPGSETTAIYCAIYSLEMAHALVNSCLPLDVAATGNGGAA
ncbi:DUF3077 domain-containing protein [Thiobaca trueperi]|uniref:DUF3077 family protein n=1 Tax=Thiobaca trueperi TaxID=127458 RepID=A0A4R3N0U6_9GAMM|nr:DUF3077 domain-containing protein [Thiobaca trueperi]TCT20643.1 DUF3077 family protein [Thiobaca trueperi]